MNEYWTMHIGNLMAMHLHKSNEYSYNKFTSDPFTFPSIDQSVAKKVRSSAGNSKHMEGENGI